MDVFNVTDGDGNKVWDKEILALIETSVETDAWGSVGVMPSKEHTSIELICTDKLGLLSEVCAVLTDLKCNAVKAEVWSHNTRVAAVVHVIDESTGLAIEDLDSLSTIKELLCNVLKVNSDSRMAKMTVSTDVTHAERRLHQMMNYKNYEKQNCANARQTMIGKCKTNNNICVCLFIICKLIIKNNCSCVFF